MSEPLSCGEALVRLLERYEVDTVFGIPGTHTIELYRGLLTSPVRHVLARHEQGAAFMADGYARSTGRPGVCFLIAGPGLMNASTAIACAYNDSVPMLVISSVTRHEALGKGWGEGHEMRDQRATMTPLTAFSATVHRPGDLPDLLGRAFAIFDTSRPRPVHIEIPTDVLTVEVPTAELERHWLPRWVHHRPAPNPQPIEAAVTMLETARRPTLYVGGGARHAAEEVTELAEKLAAPVAHTVAGTGVVAGDHPLNLGSVSFEAGRRAVEEADVVLSLGTEMGYVDRWYQPLRLEGKLIRVDIDPGKLTDHYRASVAVHGDTALAASAIAGGLTRASRRRAAEAADLAAGVRDHALASLTELERKHLRILDTVCSSVPAETRFFGDMCQLAYTACRTLRVPKPGLWHHPTGFGCLGYALPAALGARRAQPHTPLLVLTGDSGLLYTVAEMATSLDEQLPVCVVLWNNQSLAEIRDGFLSRGIQPIAVNPRPPENLALAGAFGWRTARADAHEPLREALNEAISAPRSTLIEVLESDPF